MVEIAVVTARIRAAFPDAHVEVRDLTGTLDHFDAVVVSTRFEGVSRVGQHRLVYEALGELMHGPVHALALKTYTPSTWKTAGQGSE